MAATDRHPKKILATDVEPSTPTEVVVARASTVTDATAFKPDDSHLKLAAVLFEANCPTWIELAEKAGVSRTQLWRITKDPAACAWLVAHGTKAAETGLGAVHARLLQLALTSRSPAAVELYLKRFDPNYAAKVAATGDTNITAEFATILQMSPTELDSFLRHKRRSSGLENDRERLPDAIASPRDS